MPLRLVAFHAYPLGSGMWGFVSGAAASGALGADVEVVAPDYRGRGASALPAAAEHTMPLLAKDALPLLSGDDPFVLMGLSMGGYVALELLARLDPAHRARLRGVVLCDTRAGADDEAGRKKRTDSAAAIERDGMGPVAEAMLPQFLAPGSRGGALEALVRGMVLATPPAAAAADQRGMAQRADRFDVLGSLSVPLLLAVGEGDALTPPAESERMAEAAGNAPSVSFVSIPDAAHLAPLERPELFLPALGTFLDRCR